MVGRKRLETSVGEVFVCLMAVGECGWPRTKCCTFSLPREAVLKTVHGGEAWQWLTCAVVMPSLRWRMDCYPGGPRGQPTGQCLTR